jgi:hypothetical protein
MVTDSVNCPTFSSRSTRALSYLNADVTDSLRLKARLGGLELVEPRLELSEERRAVGPRNRFGLDVRGDFSQRQFGAAHVGAGSIGHLDGEVTGDGLRKSDE